MPNDSAQHDAQELARRLSQSHQELAHARLLIDKLKTEIAYLRRMHFGRSSEQIDTSAQMELLGDTALATAPAANDAYEGETSSHHRRRQRNERQGLRELPAHLPREIVLHTPEAGCACGACLASLRPLGQDVSEVLDYVPGQFKVIRHVRPRLACPACESIVQSSAPSRPIERGLASAGLLTHVLVSKYADHTPLYRLSQIYARQGVDLQRSTLADWVGAAAALLAPLARAIGRHVLAAAKIHTDDTPIRVLGGRGQQVRTGRLWTYVRDDRACGDTSPQAVWFQYSPNRKGEHPRAHLAGFKGIVQADAFAGYDRLFDSGEIIEAGCWAHARRKFYDVHVQQHQQPGTLAHQALLRIARVFAIEADIQGQPPDERGGQRQQRSGPILAELHTWLNETLAQLSAKSPMALAIGYSLSHWRALTRFVDDGRMEAHNNIAERSLRGIAIGRKNYLHLGSDAGGERAAIVYTLLGTAKLHGIDPYAYLHQVLGCIADHPINRIDELLPWRLFPPDIAMPEQRQAA
jgi:transposase